MPMPPIQFSILLFTSPADVVRSRRALLYLLEGLVNVNVGWLQSVPRTPSLYSSNVIYRAENGTENWQDIPNVLQQGFGDCEDLASWRTAELRYAGIHAHPYIKWRDDPNDPKAKTYHACVRLPDGRIEDPSLALGMAGHPIVRQPIFISPT